MKKPRILLVQPTTIHLDGTPHKTRWRLIMGLMIPLLAGLTPDDFDVTLCDERCMMINIDPETGAQDPRVMKAVVRLNKNNAGVYATVVRSGTIRVGDRVSLVPAALDSSL